MADFLLKILGPCVGELVKYSVDPIKKEVSYLCCYSCNVKELGDEVLKLEMDKKTLEERIQRARVKWGDIRLPADVDDWLAKVNEIQQESEKIRSEAAQVQQGCLSKWIPFQHYSLSKRARKTTEAAAESRNPKFSNVADRVNAAKLPPIPVTSETFLESRKSIQDEIMAALKEEDTYLIGICGMGGVGKTTMVEGIEKMIREKSADSGKMFGRVVKAVVSQRPDQSKIQEDIAERLGLTLQEKNLEIRAERLHASLKNTQSVLIILDDVWERLSLKEIGIPSQSTHPGCKLILASRDRKAITSTAEEAKIFQLEVLSEQDSWILFKKHAGASIDSAADFNQIAKDVLNECEGLPLAIVTVGSALNGQAKESWEDALVGLRQAMPENIPDVLRGVYGPLSLSFNCLESEESRYLFLLCCLFPEDSEISLEVLVSYGTGLGVFKGIKNLAEARNRVENIVKNLISRSLLIESGSDVWGNLRVKMHDVIRDMGIWIAPKWEHVFMIRHGEEEWPMPNGDSYENYTAISLMFSEGNVDVPECIDCPRLQLLRVDCQCNDWRDGLNLPDNLFNGMRDLKVLEAFRVKSLSLSIGRLNNLRTLRLCDCGLEMISAIGKLMNLEILRLERCEFTNGVLPKEIGELKKLRELYVINCYDLGRIESGVISGLVRLEELTIVGSFNGWEAEEEDKETKLNAGLVELDSLSHLTTLRLPISNPNAIPKRKPQWAHKLKKYSVVVESSSSPFDVKLSRLFQNQKSIYLKKDRGGTPSGDWFYDDMARNAEYLELHGDSCTHVVERLVRSGYQNLTHFKLRNLENVKYLVKRLLTAEKMVPSSRCCRN